MDSKETPRPTHERSLPRRVLNWLEVDRAVFYAITSRGWQFVAGPITMILIAKYFSREVQGYYYTFWGMIGLQIFFELGFSQAVINIASHEWAKLTLNADRSIGGDAFALSRLAALFRYACFYFGVMAIVFWLVVSIAGLLFFAVDRDSEAISWRAPWLVLTALTAISFWLTPFLAVLEGCNQVKNVYKLQLVRAVLGNVVVWGCILIGGALWTPVVATIVRLLCEIYFAGVLYLRFFRDISKKPIGTPLDWWVEVWPFQWRIGVKGLFGYFNAYIMNPVVFYYFGSVAAGQLGMTWQVLSSLQAACASWFQARVARMGMLVAQKDFRELDRVFNRVARIAVGVMLVACLAFWLLDVLLHSIETPFSGRLLSPLPTALLAIGILSSLITHAQWTYIHAHQRSPFLLLTISGAIVSGLLIWWWGAWYGVLGVAVGYFAINIFFNLPVWTLVWRRCRNDWHAT
ncbi:MAG: lipopolysaccharide biosynthesis protein [Planctomycetaceae bacterium]|nr:lipopolysaccharide biosynthesis protein [Planctomycetales bacterium]MCA9145138.1 lipopolysaccharide biosynthesis protein [Planctomycetales bacterium]MCB9873272.1 lipopolysaccharide biosynthesis protein [Planctomycetaceae bacterium]MCB9939429.1 lipopolysaccharide biosynthesis protein [Planctomycetaceae bacterium]